MSIKKGCTNVHGSIIHNSQKAETIQIFISGGTTRQNMLFPCDGVLLNHNKAMG